MSQSWEDAWEEFLRSRDDRAELRNRFYEAFGIGDSAESRAAGACLIRSGAKTATSDLLWSYDASDASPPTVGAVSIVLDGGGRAACVVETVRVEYTPFSEVGAEFAAAYGEWGGTLDGWRAGAWRYYSSVCHQLGRVPANDMPLVCEWLRLVHAFDHP